MKFSNDLNGYAQRLQNELPDIGRFASSLSPLLTAKLCDQVFSTVQTQFDLTHKPKSDGNLSSLQALLDEALGKYSHPKSPKEDRFKGLFKSARDCLRAGEMICGESFFGVFDENYWPNDPALRGDLIRIREKILGTHIGGKIQGLYNHTDRTILLFARNINHNQYEDVLSVFAHEVFHAIHHFFLDAIGCTESLSEYYHTVVLESLATYFQIQYLESRGFSDKANEVRDSALRYSPIFSSEGGCARLFYYPANFGDVLALTRVDFEQALRRLVDKYDAEIILQKKEDQSVHIFIPRRREGSGIALPAVPAGAEAPAGNAIGNRISPASAIDLLTALFEGNWVDTNAGIGDDCILINGKIIHLYIVGQTKSYGIESRRGHIYAPQKGYPTMSDIRPGDVIFSCRGAQIKSVNIALESAKKTYGVEDGLRIDCLYNELSFALDIVPLRASLAGLHPFNPNGHLPQRGYIHHLHSGAAKLLMNGIKKLGNKPRK